MVRWLSLKHEWSEVRILPFSVQLNNLANVAHLAEQIRPQYLARNVGPKTAWLSGSGFKSRHSPLRRGENIFPFEMPQ